MRQQMHDFIVSMIDMVFLMPYFGPILLIIVVMGVIRWAMGSTNEDVE